MTSRKRLNVAMIGQGFMGRAHSNAFHQVGHFCESSYELKLKVICGRNQAQLKAMAARWGWEEVASDWESVVGRKDIDVVDICTPNYLHAPIAIAAAQAGKIILCEKPLASNVEDAERMVEAARGCKTLVWFNYRRVPAVRFAWELVQDGRLGNIYHYRGLYLQSWGRTPGDPAAWRFNPDHAGSGVMGDLLSHSLDLAQWLNGPIRRLCSNVRVFAERRQVDDAVSVLAEFANGSMGTFRGLYLQSWGRTPGDPAA